MIWAPTKTKFLWGKKQNPPHGAGFARLVKKVCATHRLFLIDVFSRTCAGEKHLNPSIFRKKSAKPARRPEPNSAASQPRRFCAAPRVRRPDAGSPYVGRPKSIKIKGAPTKSKILWGNQNSAKRFFDSLSKTRPHGAGFTDTALLRREYEQREKKAEIPPSPK